MYHYPTPCAGLPSQDELNIDVSHFTTAYAFIPGAVQRDIVTSFLPFWSGMRSWVLARPMTGFAETFSHMIVELEIGGGSTCPELDPEAEAVLFIVSGNPSLTVDGFVHTLSSGSYVYLPPEKKWEIVNQGSQKAVFHWIRKAYQAVKGLDYPEFFITHDQEVSPIEMPNCNGAWSTSRFTDPQDMRHDMHVNIVTFQPGGVIPFDETHVMEHGIYVLQGEADYHVNKDTYRVIAGDYLWLRAFCPQSCITLGNEPFRYLLYKDVNRHPSLKLGKS